MPSQPNVLADTRRHPVRAEVAELEPQLQRTEATAELDAVLVVVVRLPLLAYPQVLRHQAQRLAERLRPPEEQQRGVERRGHPLVRIDHDRVRTLPAPKQRSQLGRQRRRPAVRGIHVEPKPLAGADVGDRVDRVDAGRRGRAGRGDDGEGQPSLATVLLHGRGQQVGPHAVVVVGRDAPHPGPSDAHHDRRLLDRRVRLRRGVQPQAADARTTGQAFLARPEARHGMARGDERGERGDRRGIGEHAVEVVRQAQRPAKPRDDRLLKLGRRGRVAPEYDVG